MTIGKIFTRLTSCFSDKKPREVDLTKVDKQKFIESLWTSLHEMAYKDIERASCGGSKMGAFILASCYIDYLAGFRYGKETRGKDYVKFTKKYLPAEYKPWKLYTDLRCKLVHNYSEGGTYLFVDDKSALHLTPHMAGGRMYINLENFIADLKNALDKYFTEIKTNDELLKLAITRHRDIGVLNVVTV